MNGLIEVIFDSQFRRDMQQSNDHIQKTGYCALNFSKEV